MNNTLSMFKSATIKLTAWYVLILVSISLLFSVVIFSIATSEVRSRIYSLQHPEQPGYAVIGGPDYDTLRSAQVEKAQSNLTAALLTTNLCIWLIGGVGSYYLARRTLRPIEEAHDAQSRFTSDASHELRTPLASMKIELEVALGDTSTTKVELREVLASNLEEVNKLTRLSHTLLQLSRLEYDDIPRERVNVHSAAQAAIRRFAQHERIDSSGARNIFAQANRTNVEELVTILVDNALKYSPPKSRVQLATYTHKQLVGFQVTNRGEGISPAILPRIFNRFYRADRSRASVNGKSYGLGLSLAKKIVELHGGELSVSSGKKALTTFSVLLPAAKKT